MKRFSNNECTVLTECFRRIHFFKSSDYYTEFALLEFASNVNGLIKRGLVKPSFSETRKANNWYSLTDSGIELLKSVPNRFITDYSNLEYFEGRVVINFNNYCNLF